MSLNKTQDEISMRHGMRRRKSRSVTLGSQADVDKCSTKFALSFINQDLPKKLYAVV